MLSLNSYGVYNSFYVENNYFAGGTPLRYAFVGGLSSGVAFAVAPLANFLAKRFHFRVPMIVGMWKPVRIFMRLLMLRVRY